MADVSVRAVSKRFGTTTVLKDIDLAVRDGEFLTLIGASGCGKSTLLRIIAGLEAQTDGTIAIGGRSVDHLRPRQRRVAMVFQSYALYPHMTVAENIATPLVMDRTFLAERLPLARYLSPRRPAIERSIAADVGRVAEQLQIEPLLRRKPAQLSGGQRQRVALGRAMVREPDVFLMDEPLSNLDATLRVHMRNELAELHKRLGATFIYVTHDQVEAMTMSNRVALMDGGAILQVGTPHELYHLPETLAVARFLGSPRINVFAGSIANGCAVTNGASVAAAALPDADVLIGVRPEGIALVSPATQHAVPAHLRGIEDLGHEAIVLARLPGPGGIAPETPDWADEEVRIRLTGEAFAAARAAGTLSDTLALTFHPAAIHLFRPNGERIAAQARAIDDRPVDSAIDQGASVLRAVAGAHP